jgi:hypothetical protein
MVMLHPVVVLKTILIFDKLSDVENRVRSWTTMSLSTSAPAPAARFNHPANDYSQRLGEYLVLDAKL